MARGAPVIAMRPMRKEDVAAVSTLEGVVYPQPWSARVFLDELAQESRFYVVAEEGDVILGYAGLMVMDEEAHVTTVAVAPDHRGRGVGTRLMLALVEAALARGARHLTLEVRVSNRGAQEMYRRFGMAPVGMRKRYYAGEDALVMWATDIHLPEYRERLEEIRSSLPAEDREGEGFPASGDVGRPAANREDA